MMFNRQISLLLLLYFSFSISAQPLVADTHQPIITIKLNNAPSVRNGFLPLFKQFESETGIKVIPLHYINDTEFREFIQRSDNEKAPLPDVLNGLNSERLYEIIRNDLIHPITHLWKEKNWQADFPPNIVQWLTHNNEIYALPYTKYTWGFFYRKSFLAQFGNVPSDWSDFMAYCEKIKKSGIDLFPMTEKQPWIAAAWFEYLTLRMHGISVFNGITQGKISFHDKRIQDVFSAWKEMIDKGFFTYTYKSYQWQQQLPPFLRNKFAFMFMNTSLARRIYDPDILADTQFMAFPKMRNIPNDETSPVSLFFISKNSKNKKNAEKLLTFIARAASQEVIAEKLFSVPVNLASKPPQHRITASAHKILNSADSLSPFFDRAINQDFAKVSLRALATFMTSGDIKSLTMTLEKARIHYYIK
mgnify:CR=1 FL=1